jgi:hypothetical protein
MPLKLTVSVSRKMGLPDFGSRGAACGIELELDASLLLHDLDGFQRAVRDAYVACDQAVDDELARHEQHSVHTNGHAAHAGGHENGHAMNGSNGRRNGSRAGAGKPATPSQVRAIHAIANRQAIDLSTLLPSRYRVETAEELSIRDASRLIDELQGESA